MVNAYETMDPEEVYDIPDDSMLCSDDCAGCMVCFRMKKDQSVYFNEH